MSLLFDGPAGYTLETLFACVPFWSWIAPQETPAPFSKLLKSTLGYTAVVHEEIPTVLVRGDEAVTFVVTEPLNCCLGHVWSPPFTLGRLHRNKKPPRRSERRFHQSKTQLLGFHSSVPWREAESRRTPFTVRQSGQKGTGLPATRVLRTFNGSSVGLPVRLAGLTH